MSTLQSFRGEAMSSRVPDLRSGADEHAVTRTELIRQPTEPIQLSIKKFSIVKELGEGGFGRAYLARFCDQNYICVLKVMAKNYIQEVGCEHMVRREIEIHSQIRHPNIIRMFGHFHDSENVYLILEYAPGGDLYTPVDKYSKTVTSFSSILQCFTESQAAEYVDQVASALEYLHEKNLLHRDLKLENVLIAGNGKLKLADFGHSVLAPKKRRKTFCGTLYYQAPEMLKLKSPDDCYNEKVDLWSLGILLYELLFTFAPFEKASSEAISTEDQDNLMMERIRTCKLAFPPSTSVSKEAQDLIKRLLTSDPHQRISAAETRNHPWILMHCGKSKAGAKL